MCQRVWLNMKSELEILKIYAETCEFKKRINYSQATKYKHDLTFDIHLLINKDDEHQGIIRLGCEVNNENVTEAPFVLTLVLAGEFYAHDSPFEQYVVNAASLLFPYLRTYISTVTAMSGVEPLTIPALNMYELLASMNNDISE